MKQKKKKSLRVARGNVAIVYHVRSATCVWRVYTHINKFWLLNKGGNFDIINDHAEVDHKLSLWIYE